MKMMVKSIPGRGVLIVLLVVLLQACATTPQAPNVSTIFKGKTFLVMPGESVNARLNRSANSLQTLVVVHLQQLGYPVAEMSGETYQRMNDIAIKDSGSIYKPGVGRFLPLKPERYASSMIAQWAAEHNLNPADVVLFKPELVIRAARLREGELFWDYQQQPVPAGVPTQVQRFRGLSVAFSAFGDGGELLWQGFQGVLMPFEWRRQEGASGWYLKENLSGLLAPVLAAQVECGLQPLKASASNQSDE